MRNAPPRLELRGITKRFGDTAACDGVDLTLAPGECHALLGENGAGKSTLVKIVYGLLRPDAGTIRWEGREVVTRGPSAARRLGIGMVFQHFSLFDSLSVAETIAVSLDNPGPMAALCARIEAVSEHYGLALDPRRSVHALSVGERQRVEIVRCLLQDPALLILDEPTSVLTPAEAAGLFRTLERLAGEGRSVLLISHKLAEVRALCHRATVLRDGRVAGEADPRAASTAQLAELMIGHVPAPVRRPADHRFGPVRLAVRGLSARPADPAAAPLRDIRLEVRGGEILGIAGVAGNGQNTLIAALSGQDYRFDPETISIDGHPAGALGPRARRRLGLAVVPEDRTGTGAVPALTLAGNGLLTGLDRRRLARPGGFVRFRPTLQFASEIIARFQVSASGPMAVAGSLSGGNLQKFVVGREILQEPGVLVAAAPTWGVDAGAAAAIHRAVLELAAAGAAVLVVSPDLDELTTLCDRVLVMSGGRVVETDNIALAMGGIFETETTDATARATPATTPPPPAAPEHAKAKPGGRRAWTLEPRAAPSPLWAGLAPLLALTLTALAGAGLFAATGHPPLATLHAYFLQPLTSTRGLADLAVKATPLALCGTGLALAFRANVWNIGAEGQLTMGALAGSAVALAAYGQSGWWTLPAMLAAGVAGGMAWAALPALLRVRWGASEILTSLMLSYVASLILDWMVRGPLRDPDGFAFPESRLFEPAALLPTLIPDTRLHAGVLVAVTAAALAWVVLRRTLIGFEITVFGLSPTAAGYAGFRRGRLVWLTLLTSGGLAGLAGTVEVAGPLGQLTPAVSPGYGFTAIIVAFLGRLHPAGVIGAALIMALTYIGADLAQIRFGLPQAVGGVFQGLLLFALLAADLPVRYRLVRRTEG